MYDTRSLIRSHICISSVILATSLLSVGGEIKLPLSGICDSEGVPGTRYKISRDDQRVSAISYSIPLLPHPRPYPPKPAVRMSHQAPPVIPGIGNRRSGMRGAVVGINNAM